MPVYPCGCFPSISLAIFKEYLRASLLNCQEAGPRCIPEGLFRPSWILACTVLSHTWFCV